MVASDRFPPNVRLRRGNTCSQFFVATTSDWWEVYPMKTESHNCTAPQYYTRNAGVLPTIKLIMHRVRQEGS
eukprot:14422332-Ditylum_brightwellii.AAC.1